jgi:hypothetical protein
MVSQALTYQDAREKSGRRHLKMSRAGSLARHPADGWVMADPHPMGPWVRRAFHAVIRAVVPPLPAPQPPELVERIELYVRRFMSYMHPLAALGLMIGFVLLDWAPRLLFRSWHRLQGLGRSEAARMLDALLSSRIQLLRTVVVAVRGAILSAYFDQDEVHRALGYSPVPFMRERILRRRQLSAPAAAAPVGRAS